MAAGCGVILAFIGAFTIVGSQAGAPTTPIPQLRGNKAETGTVTLRVLSKALFPVTLVNCDGNVTVPAFQEYVSTMAVEGSNFFWVVPEGAPWDCENGCPDCFFLAWGLETGGGLLARLGYETSEHDGDGEESQQGDDESSNATITGVKLITRTNNAPEASSACGESTCNPDWERDHSVAWSSTMDLIIQGSTQLDLTGSNTMMALGYRGRARFRVKGPNGGVARGRAVYRGGYRGGYGGYGGYGRRVYRPPIWRRPVWVRPVYPHPACYVCSAWCQWLCAVR